jgi:dihydrofolate synthase/folylpolyglutamate synthase
MRTYSQAIEYLTGFINYERRKPPAYSPETLNLDRMHSLLCRLGDPHQAYRTIHIAGTKGKGSTAAMIESILRAAGYRTGLYTSPHLHTFRERVRVNGETISREAFAALIDDVAPHVADIDGVTWFEIVTALGFLHFARSRVEAGVIEVGLGGRFDATNVITPVVSAITSLSMDHMAWLGDTLEQIAFEKAGIIKPNVPVVSAPQPAEALAVVERVSAERGAPLTVVGREVTFERLAASRDGQEFRVASTDSQLTRSLGATESVAALNIPLLGAHQVINAAVALTAIDIATAQDLAVGVDAIRAGLRDVHWAGRFEIARRDPPLVFDGAHNADSAHKLAEALREVFPGLRWTLIFGASADKEIDKMLDALLPVADRVIVTRARNVRAADIESIAELAAARHAAVEVASNVGDALNRAIETNAPVIVTGSIFIIADARESWFERNGRPLADRDA